jgi:hypothetical protein
MKLDRVLQNFRRPCFLFTTVTSMVLANCDADLAEPLLGLDGSETRPHMVSSERRALSSTLQVMRIEIDGPARTESPLLPTCLLAGFVSTRMLDCVSK